MAPSRDLCETLTALTGADVCTPARAMLDAGDMHGDPECAAAGALLTFTRELSLTGHFRGLVAKMRAAAPAAEKELIRAA